MFLKKNVEQKTLLNHHYILHVARKNDAKKKPTSLFYFVLPLKKSVKRLTIII